MIIKYTNQNIQTLSKELLQFYDLGVEKDFENQINILPYKKKKGMKLVDSQKEWNKFQAKV